MLTPKLKPGVNVVVGLPASGKTTLTKKLDAKGYSVYHTDDYKKYGWNLSYQQLIEDLYADKNPNKLIEGVLAFRLLRNGARDRTFAVNHIIVVECDVRRRVERYADDPQREGKDATKMDHKLTNLWEEYIEEYKRESTTIEVYDTSSSNG